MANKTKRKVTSKKYTDDKLRLFAEKLRELGNQTKAYTAVFGTAKDSATNCTMASRLMRQGSKTREFVVKHIDYLNDSAENRGIHKEAIAKGDEVAIFFTSVMRGQETDAFGLDVGIESRMKAAENLAKMHQMFTQNVNVTTTQVQIIDDMDSDTDD